jgi:hypothetical protein
MVTHRRPPISHQITALERDPKVRLFGDGSRWNLLHRFLLKVVG